MAIVLITKGNVTKGCVGLGLGFDWNCRRRTGDKKTQNKKATDGREKKKSARDPGERATG